MDSREGHCCCCHRCWNPSCHEQLSFRPEIAECLAAHSRRRTTEAVFGSICSKRERRGSLTYGHDRFVTVCSLRLKVKWCTFRNWRAGEVRRTIFHMKLSPLPSVPVCFIAMCGIGLLASAPASAQTEENFRGKMTFGVYAAGDQPTVDVNARYSAGNWTGWLGWYGPHSEIGSQARAGLEYDMRRRRMLIIPSIQAASQSFVGASLYSEIGGTVYAIAGASRTNLEPYVNLNFDPNESWQLGGGAHFHQADSVAAFTVWDNRLHTSQQNTHVIVRHYFARTHRVTLDVSYKSGRGDSGDFVRGTAIGSEVDWHRWFVKGARDAHVNYSAETMWRFGGGVRF